MYFPKNRSSTKIHNMCFLKSGRRPKCTKCVFLKIGLPRSPKSVYGLSAREKLLVFVCISFFRGAQQVKFGNSRRRKYRILTKCPNFSGECLIRIFFSVKHILRKCAVFRVYEGCRVFVFCLTQKICTKSRKLYIRRSEVCTAGFFVFSSILRSGKKV